jgi:hypothetical protein
VTSVTVTDEELPIPLCNAPATISPHLHDKGHEDNEDAPTSFQATATDNCGARATITGFECFKADKDKGKHEDKRASCRVSIAGDTIRILKAGGVGHHIRWQVMATDVNGNVASKQCEIGVANPGRGK